MVRKSLVVVIFSLILFSASLVSALPSGPWKGRIIDIETKEPIEGAVVLAVWMRAYRTPAGDNTYYYNSKEVLTDKDGRFEIPSYKPINLLPIISYIREPEFIIFKPGYLSIDIRLDENVTDQAADLPEKGKTFRLSPGIIELPELKTREERLRVIGSLPPSIPDQAMPNLIKLMNSEEINLGLQPTHVGGTSK